MISDQMSFQEAKSMEPFKWGEPTEPAPHIPLKLPQSMTSSLHPTMNVWAYVTYSVSLIFINRWDAYEPRRSVDEARAVRATSGHV